MARIQQIIDVKEVAISAPEWDVVVDYNFEQILEHLNTWEMTEAGNIVTIQLQDAKGEDVAEEHFLRVRICDVDEFAVSGISEFIVTTGTVVETHTANKDVTIQSDASGVIVIDLYNPVTTTTQEPVVGTLRIGSPSVGSRLGDYSNTLTLS